MKTMQYILARSLVAAAVLGALTTAGACGSDDNAPTESDAGSLAETGVDSTTPTDAAISDAADAADTSTTLSPNFVHRDINHILSTGQSLSTGAFGDPILSTSQPYANTRFVGGPRNGGSGLTSFMPLVEDEVETMSSSLANLVTKMSRDDLLRFQPAGKNSHDLLVSVHGIIGVGYSVLKKNGSMPAFANGINQAKAALALATAAGQSYVVRCVTNVHGESDHLGGNTNYEANLFEWQSDYETDVKAITGQPDPIPMLHTQFSSWTQYSTATSAVAMAQLAAHVDKPGKIVLVGAKYHLPYVSDGVHLSNEGYRHMGEDYAKVYRRVILEGQTWEPVHPKSVTRAGAVVTAKMHVPAPPLVLDTTLVTDPGSYGFEWSDASGAPPTITKVEITAPDTVQITLSAAPTGTNKRLRYAYTGIIGAKAGATSGPRGNLRDSDATPSRSGYKLYNWGVHFDVASP